MPVRVYFKVTFIHCIDTLKILVGEYKKNQGIQFFFFEIMELSVACYSADVSSGFHKKFIKAIYYEGHIYL